MLIDQCLAQSSSEKLPPAEGGSKCRDPHLDNVKRVRDLVTVSPKWKVITKYLPSWFREDCEKGGRKNTEETRHSKLSRTDAV